MTNLIALLFLAAPIAAEPVKLPQSNLGTSVGYLVVEESEESERKVLSSTFEEFRTTTSADAFNAWFHPEGRADQPEPEGAPMVYRYAAPGMEDDSSDPSTKTLIEYKDKGRVLTFWRDSNFEGSDFVIVVWRRSKNALILEAVLDHALHESIGAAWFLEAHKIDAKRHLIIGRTGGGDGGDTWGSLWVGLWTEPRKFEILLREKHQTVLGGDDSEVRYEFDPKNLALRLTRMSRKPQKNVNGEDEYSAWADDKSWTVDLRKTIAAAAAR